MARSFLARLSKFVGQVTFKIKLGTQDEAIAEICRRRKLDDKQRQFLIELASTKAGTAFINEKVQDINRGAFHRSRNFGRCMSRPSAG
jgi:hypothetical protein